MFAHDILIMGGGGLWMAANLNEGGGLWVRNPQDHFACLYLFCPIGVEWGLRARACHAPYDRDGIILTISPTLDNTSTHVGVVQGS